MRDPIRVTTLTRFLNRIRRSLSRSQWMVWLLGLPRSGEAATEPGLIMIQIDGLSATQLDRALADGRIPFLKSLLDKETYRRHSMYSGLPSSTPGFQGELYYGVPTVVPAFGFRDHRTGRLARMFESKVANEIETMLGAGRTPGSASEDRFNQPDENSESLNPDSLALQVENATNRGLLTGGSSYGNIYSGGASEVHFCATSFGWSEFFRTVNPIRLVVVMLLNFWMFFRIAGLMVVEFFLAILDFVRGILSGHQFWQELIMIPARVMVVVLLRELVTLGACNDSLRGLPVIHLNLLGYDEQAHRRGPESRFAHWTLRGIDKSIRRVWKAAHRGTGREYDVWVFSDHGQETTRPYQLQHGKLIQEVVAEIVDGGSVNKATSNTRGGTRVPSRASWLGVGWLVSMLFGEQDHDLQSRSPNVQTVTSGPLGFVYLLFPDGKLRCDEIARRLASEFGVPMVVQAVEGNQAKITTPDGGFVLPQDAILVFGADHPFLEDVTRDLLSLIQHPDAGDLVLVGWNRNQGSTSFVLQNGAHAGPGFAETGAFALLPADIPVGEPAKRYLRPNDLRLAALRFLGREPAHRSRQVNLTCRDEGLRIMTYNVHACVGMDGELSPERIARVIAQSGANIVCLQELDVFRMRSGNRDQAHAIALHLEMNHKFHPAWHLQEESFGNAILTRFPMRMVEMKGLHHHKSDRSRRSALWAEIELSPGFSLQLINTHLSIYPKEQLIQAQQLMDEWVHPASLLGPVVLCGDFNARPDSATHRAFSQRLLDVETFDKTPARSTYFSPFPVARVDHIFVTPGLIASNTQVVGSRIAKVASDHLPLVTDVKLDRTQPGFVRQTSGANQSTRP